MHWFGELLALYLLIAGGIFAPVSYVVTKRKLAERKLAENNLRMQEGWVRAFNKLYDANAAVIAELDSLSFAVPKMLVDDLIAAHEAASQFIRRVK